MKIFLTFLLILLAGSSTVLFGQQLPEKGVPLLQNYSPAEYDHKGKVWDIDSAPNGIVYMASDKGLLEYDGTTWKHYKGSEGVTRSVRVVSDTLIYTGSDLDFGVWRRNAYNDFEYRSLYPFKEDLSEINEEFWDVHYLDETPYFISSSNIYVHRNGSLTKIPAPGEINSSFLLDDSIYFFDEQEGVFLLDDLSPRRLFGTGNTPFDIVGIFAEDDSLVLVTQNSGLYRYKSGDFSRIDSRFSDTLEEANVFSFEKINESQYAFGTILRGLFISDREGRIIHNINKNKGLQNNTILGLHYSNAGKLWLSMDYGVSNLDLGSEFSFFYDYRGDFGTAHSAVLDGDTFYMGTNQGLYRASWDALNDSREFYEFGLVPGTEGQVWTLQTIDGELFMGHDRGLFKREGEGFTRINDERRGTWTVEQYGDYLLAGTYNGISIFRKNGGDWTYQDQMELILGSCNQVMIEGENTLWVNIPNFGVLKASLDENLYPENRVHFPTSRFRESDHYLVMADSAIEVHTESGVFLFDEVNDRFVERDENQNTQPVIDNLKLPNSQPNRLNDQYEFYPVYNGFALKNLKNGRQVQEFNPRLQFRNVVAFNNEENTQWDTETVLPYELNNLRIDLNVPNQQEVLYQYRTESGGEWSEWSANSTIELVGLDHGSHTITARAMIEGDVTEARDLSIQLSTPWYLSWFALTGYVILIFGLLYVLYLWQEISLSRQKKSLLASQRDNMIKEKERHRIQIQKVEEEKLQAEIERLKEQFKSKTIELATKAKENDEKNRILLTLKEKFDKLEENPKTLPHRSREIKQIIESHISSDDNTFEIQIDELHQDFFETLRTQFPDLTLYDLRLCAYIKIGFDSREISEMLNIKPSSVYISRSRLRKKLGLESDDDLHSFLNSV
ncbi:MAG: hypothetical protein ACQERO_01765 [Bacteroidota bacterium]